MKARQYELANPFKTGAGNETRTRDPDLGKVVLYQLSYSRNNALKSETRPTEHSLLCRILLTAAVQSISLFKNNYRLLLFTALCSFIQQIFSCRTKILKHRPESEYRGDV